MFWRILSNPTLSLALALLLLQGKALVNMSRRPRNMRRDDLRKLIICCASRTSLSVLSYLITEFEKYIKLSYNYGSADAY